MKMPSPQEKAPLLEALVAYAEEGRVSFHTPGHKHGHGIPKALHKAIGEKIFKLDLSVMPEVDSLHEPSGVILEAQRLAAQAFGADETSFLVNGTTGGNHAMILATCRPGDKIILPRNAHKSVLAAVALAGADPVYLMPRVDDRLDLLLNISPDQVHEACMEHPDAKAVLVTSPNYFGLAVDLPAIEKIVHAHGKLLLVDEAHGPHLCFHPDLPAGAMEAGADLCVQSTHKHLSALSQGSMLHVKGSRVDRAQLKTTLQMLQTTSPSYVILASLDAARRQMALEGRKLLTRLLEYCERARKEITTIEGFACLTRKDVGKLEHLDFDPTKIVISTRGIRYAGHNLAKILSSEYGIQVEMADFQNVLLFASIGSRWEDFRKIIRALKKIAGDYRDLFLNQRRRRKVLFPLFLPKKVLTPREALALPARRVSLREAVGSISAEMVCPYPPGIPVLCPGELLTPEVYQYLMRVLDSGARINGQADGGLRTLRVVEETSLRMAAAADLTG